MRAVLAAVLALLPGMATAQPVTVRAGNHPGHGRLVFDWPAPPAYSLERDGEAVLLRFPAGAIFDLPGRLPRNLVGLEPTGAGIGIRLRAGASMRHFRLGNRVVVDLLDPPAGSREPEARPNPPSGTASAAARMRPDEPGGAARQPARDLGSAPVPAGQVRATLPVLPPAPPPQPASGAAGPEPSGPVAAAEAAGPVSRSPLARPGTESAQAVSPPRPGRSARLLPGAERPAALLPVPPGTGAAVLRRGGEVLLVLDHPEPPDLAPLRGDPVFGALAAEALPDATLLRLPLTSPNRLAARRDAAGWVLEAVRPDSARPPALTSVTLEAEAGPPPRLLLRAAAPGRTVPVTDPETGLPLLLGTMREGTVAVPLARRLPDFDLLPTELGTAVLARSDGITLLPGTDRFTLIGGAWAVSLDPAVMQAEAGAAMTRSFDLPDRSPAELFARLQGLQAGIAAAPPLARLTQRRAAGETLLALGLPQEAQAVLALGFAEDPRAAADPVYAALSGAAALLGGRLPEAGALRAPALPASDEATLWRAALAAAGADGRGAAPGFAATLPLLLAYPTALKARLLPLAGLALAEAGEGAALRRLLAAVGEQAAALALPAAMLAETEGRVEEALAGYDRVAAGQDRRARARAIRRAVELRLAAGRIQAGQAARALEAALFAWRGDATEVELRVRLAALRRESGDGGGALTLLRETAAMLPEEAAALQPAIRDAFLAALAESPPLAAVTLHHSAPELLPDDARGDAAMQILAERLLALDLGDRAALLLRAAMERASGARRAALGLRLAAIRFGEGDAAGTLAALHDSASAEAPPEMVRDRTVLEARAEARRGRQAEAVAALRALGPQGGEFLAELLAEGSEWGGAATALGSFLATALPAPPAPLDAAQRRLLLRQAALLALAGDDAGLAALRVAQASRMGDGALAEAFALLTADPLRGLADLPRLQRELQLFRNFPGRLEALRTGTPVTR